MGYYRTSLNSRVGPSPTRRTKLPPGSYYGPPSPRPYSRNSSRYSSKPSISSPLTPESSRYPPSRDNDRPPPTRSRYAPGLQKPPYKSQAVSRHVDHYDDADSTCPQTLADGKTIMPLPLPFHSLAYYDDSIETNGTSSLGSTSSKYIRGWNHIAMTYDSSVYQPGLIFKIPNHRSSYGNTLAEKGMKTRTKYGNIYSKLRMMVVIEVHADFCISLPIYSHNGGGLSAKSAQQVFEFVSIRDSDDANPEPQETPYGLLTCRAIDGASKERLNMKMNSYAAEEFSPEKKVEFVNDVRAVVLNRKIISDPDELEEGEIEEKGPDEIEGNTDTTLAVSGKSCLSIVERTTHLLRCKAQLVGYLDNKSLLHISGLLRGVSMNQLAQINAMFPQDSLPQSLKTEYSPQLGYNSSLKTTEEEIEPVFP